AFWKERLAGAPRLLELSTDRPRPAVQTSNGAARPVALPAAVSAAIRGICREEGATPFMVLLAAWSVVLGRSAGQEDVVVGTPIAGRNRREIEDLIGFFVNTLVLRSNLSGHPPFRELLGRSRSMALDAFAHQDLPFERLVGELVPERDLSHAPLFQVLFAVQNAPVQSLAIPGLAFAPVPADSQIAKFDLELTLWEGAAGFLGGFLGALAYNTDLFDGTTAERLVDRFAALLEAALDDPERSVAELPLLLPGERQQVLVEANDTRDAYPREASVPERFAAVAAARPDALAVVDEDGTGRSYRWLDEASSRLAWHLAGLGIGLGSRVGVAMERSVDLVVAFLGILKSGAAYVPLDPAYPEERLAFMREDAGASIVLGPTLPTGETPRGAFLEISADALAYVVYTSGSTGKPKGVAVSHRGILSLVHGTADLRLGPADRLAFNANTSFDAATYEIWATLLAGGALVVIPQNLLLSPPDLAAALRRHQVTVLHLTTALFNRVVREAPEVLASPSLRCALFGGEASDPGAVAQALAGVRPARLLHTYGPTESTTFATFHPVTSLAAGAATVPIGRPLANTTAVLLDPAGAPAPLGAAGELFLGGDGLAWGYLNRPDLTAERFVPDAWSGAPGERLYRTGDLVRRRADGVLEFQRRIDSQVKIRGFRIEPGEIEAVLGSHPAVGACAVAVRGDRLIAYVVLDPTDDRTDPTDPTDRSDAKAALAAWLREQLPDYMVPSAFVVLETLPLTPNGKVDRKALPAPERAFAAPGSGEPSTPAEALLARVWAEVLGLERVGVHDNFFELGGDSILSIQVVSRARQAGLWLAPRDLFQNQTVAALAAVARTAPGTAGEEEAPEGDVPLTPIQRWFFDLDLQDLHHYNQALVLSLRERVDPGRLEQALAAVVSHHAALRFHYAREEGTWRQILGSPSPGGRGGDGRGGWGVRSIDLSPLPAPQRASALETVAAQLQASLDVERGPLLSAALFDLGAAGQRLFLVFHHLIVDGVSWRILLDDLGTAYRGGELPPVHTSLRRWAAQLAEVAGGEEAAWDVPTLPVDRREGPDTVASARRLVAELDEEETRALLRDVPAVYRTRIDDALLTALLDAFAAWTGEPRLLVDLEGHGRGDLDDPSGEIDLSRTVGWLTEIAPVLLELDPRESDPGERLKSVKEQLRAKRRGGRPAAQVVFNYLGQLDRG
ncbi:MAG TPA: amino acid adenylation domain-containing protein, partial [Thermoanaerobaculia bacterium]|nr:amino acid adenylation domain-containing protein [Thermoanaerobaculia bacterium]